MIRKNKINNVLQSFYNVDVAVAAAANFASKLKTDARNSSQYRRKKIKNIKTPAKNFTQRKFLLMSCSNFTHTHTFCVNILYRSFLVSMQNFYISSYAIFMYV